MPSSITRVSSSIGFSLLFLASPLFASAATTYNVSTTGTDNASCGPSATPCRTITYAYAKVSAGDTVLVSPGTYTDYTTGWGIYLNKNGSAGAPITLKSAVKGQAIIDGSAVTNPSTRLACIVTYGTSYNIVDGFSIRNCLEGGITLFPNGTTPSSFNKFINNEIYNIANHAPSHTGKGGQGIGESAPSHDNYFAGNYIHDNGAVEDNGGVAGRDIYDHGMYMEGSNNSYINNIVTRNMHGSGIQIASYNNMTNAVAYNNTVTNNKVDGITIWSTGSGSFTGLKVKNNIVSGNGGFGIGGCAPVGSGFAVSNNLEYSNTRGAFSADYCGSATVLSQSAAVLTNPVFVNSASDLHLQSSSPAINAGATIASVPTDFGGSTRPQGSAYDIGAYEYVVAIPAPTVTLSASPTSIISGSSSTLTWSSTNATSCTGTGFIASATSGSVSVSPVATQTYSISCTGTGGSATQSTTVTVSAAAPVISMSPASLAFASTNVGVTSSVQYVTISNTGSANLVFSTIVFSSGSFAPAGLGTCGVSNPVTPGGSCTISVVFTPTSIGTNTGSITMTDNAVGSPHVINLSGTGANPADITSPSTPANLSTTVTSSSQINLTWTASTDNVGVTGYKIFRDGTQVGTSATASYSDTGLTAATAYTYTVSAYDAAGNDSTASTIVSATTLPVTAAFTIGDRMITTAGLNVRASASISGTLLGTQSLGSFGTLVGGPTIANGYIWWNINYDAGADGWSVQDYIANAPIDSVSPSIPAGLSATAASSAQINLTWTASTDNVGVTGYNIFRDGTQIGTSATASYSDTGLTANTVYAYTVAAYDATNNTSAQSSAVSAITKTSTGSIVIGSRVMATANLNVRQTASPSGTKLGTEPVGSLGTVIGGPKVASGHTWRQVTWDNGLSGWSIYDYIANGLPESSSAVGMMRPSKPATSLIAQLTQQVQDLLIQIQFLQSQVAAAGTVTGY